MLLKPRKSYPCLCVLNIMSKCFFDNYLFQVHLQTQQKATEGLLSMGVKVFKNEGFFGLYNGVSASILRQVVEIKILCRGIPVIYLFSSMKTIFFEIFHRLSVKGG